MTRAVAPPTGTSESRSPSTHTDSPGVSTPGGSADSWLATWPTRGPDADDQREVATDTAAAADALNTSRSRVHLLYAGSLDDGTNVAVAATACTGCGSPTVTVVVIRVDGNGSVLGTVTQHNVPVGPAVGVVPLPAGRGIWSVAVIAAPGVASAEIRFVQGMPYEPMPIGGDGVASVPVLAGGGMGMPSVSPWVRLFAADGTQLAEVNTTTGWDDQGNWPGLNGGSSHGGVPPWHS